MVETEAVFNLESPVLQLGKGEMRAPDKAKLRFRIFVFPDDRIFPVNSLELFVIHHIHLSDNDGSYDMHDALGTHNIDFERLFEILKKNKYDDICVIEVYTPHQILKSIDYLKKINIL